MTLSQSLAAKVDDRYRIERELGADRMLSPEFGLKPRHAGQVREREPACILNAR